MNQTIEARGGATILALSLQKLFGITSPKIIRMGTMIKKEIISPYFSPKNSMTNENSSH